MGNQLHISIFSLLHVPFNFMFIHSRMLNGNRKTLRFIYQRLVKEVEIKRHKHIHLIGIETSCDDTGIALVNNSRKVYANVLNNQHAKHIRFGGIIPPMAQNLHRKNIEIVFNKCMEKGNVNLDLIDAIAVTIKPGLPLSLLVGFRYAKSLARVLMKPLIPIHHMEAHALAIRMEQHINFPYLCLLISGGHCQLVIVKSSSKFYLLGETLDDAPGEMFDKIARRLKLLTIPKYRSLNGGQAIEKAANESKRTSDLNFPTPLAHCRNCNFSFAGIKNYAYRYIKKKEAEQNIPPGAVITNYREFCAGLLNAASMHLLNRTQRALEYCIQNNVFNEENRVLVVSGGVAANDFIFEDLSNLAAVFKCKTYRPSKAFCSDNGAMIAWNGIEKMLQDKNVLSQNYNNISILAKTSLGESLTADIERCNIKCTRIKRRLFTEI